MDPQLRKLLEVSYEALIHSGLIIGNMPSERCGVYIGCCGSEVRICMLCFLISGNNNIICIIAFRILHKLQALYWQPAKCIEHCFILRLCA